MCREPDPVMPPFCEAGRLVAPKETPEEELILDRRAALRPALFVHEKLIGMLRGDALRVSHAVVAHHGRRRAAA